MVVRSSGCKTTVRSGATPRARTGLRCAALRRRRTDPQGIGTTESGTIQRMNTPSSVVGCSTCGALYTPEPGDQGVCEACRSFLPGPAARPVSGKPAVGAVKRPSVGPMRLGFLGRLPMRHIAKGAVILALAGGVGTVIMVRPKPVMDVWNKVRHHAPSSPSEAWASVRHHAADAWTSIRRHIPFGSSPQAERSASVAAATTAVADRDASDSHSTSRRTKKKRSRRE